MTHVTIIQHLPAFGAHALLDPHSTDVHFGLIPLEPARNEENVPARYVTAFVGDEEPYFRAGHTVMAFTDGDSFVEWGERRGDYADRPARHANGRLYGAPGLHVVVRFGPEPPLVPEYYPESRKPFPVSNPTGLWKDVPALAADRRDEYFALGIQVVETVFADLLSDGYRLCDYACLTDATDWTQKPVWHVGHSSTTVGMYA